VFCVSWICGAKVEIVPLTVFDSIQFLISSRLQ